MSDVTERDVTANALRGVEAAPADAGARIGELEAALDRYGGHRPGCARIGRVFAAPCTCGLYAALGKKPAGGAVNPEHVPEGMRRRMRDPEGGVIRLTAALAAAEARAERYRAVLEDLHRILVHRWALCRSRGEHPSCPIEQGSTIDDRITAALAAAPVPRSAAEPG